ncbi:MAG: hypothetical protein ACK57X_00010 [Bacteroidota bacterium]
MGDFVLSPPYFFLLLDAAILALSGSLSGPKHLARTLVHEPHRTARWHAMEYILRYSTGHLDVLQAVVHTNPHLSDSSPLSSKSKNCISIH